MMFRTNRENDKILKEIFKKENITGFEFNNLLYNYLKQYKGEQTNK